jgi:hypothetical protein
MDYLHSGQVQTKTPSFLSAAMGQEQSSYTKFIILAVYLDRVINGAISSSQTQTAIFLFEFLHM